MKMRLFAIILLAAVTYGYACAQDNKNTLPDLQKAESIFFDPNAKQKDTPYQFSAPWRFEVGYAQLNHRTQDTSAIYMHGMRVGTTVDFLLPYNFSIQTGALATFTYGQNNQHWPSMDEESAQINILKHNILQLQLTIPVRAYYNIRLWKELHMFFFAGPQLQIGLTHYDIVENRMSQLTTQWIEEQGIKTTNHDQYVEKQLYPLYAVTTSAASRSPENAIMMKPKSSGLPSAPPPRVPDGAPSFVYIPLNDAFPRDGAYSLAVLTCDARSVPPCGSS